ncbi:MAG: metallopeptidase family protein [Oscillospiraceae bacterium]|nr:metallopeptidase family protein [Oscillospiraceae bacterium]
MVSIEEFEMIADEIANSIPEEFYRRLNGGILVSESEKLHPKSLPFAPLYIMGEYSYSRDLGRMITIYYGSFSAVYGYLTPEDLKKEIRRTLLHEFTHHLESLSGLSDLEVKDKIELEQYKQHTKLHSKLCAENKNT